MRNARLLERVRLLRARGGGPAAVYWLLRNVLRVDVFCFYAVRLGKPVTDGGRTLPEGFEFLRLSTPDEITACDPILVSDIDSKSGSGSRRIVADGGRIYAIVHGTAMVSKLEIEFRRSHVDTPLDLVLEVGERDAFLSFLYTDPSTRQGGWASRLILHACAQLGAEGWEHCICHVQATNVPSSNTFRRCGWAPVAWLFVTTGGRLLHLWHGAAARDLGVRVNARAP